MQFLSSKKRLPPLKNPNWDELACYSTHSHQMFETHYNEDQIQLVCNMKKCLGNDYINTGRDGSLFRSTGLKSTLSWFTAIFDIATLFYKTFSPFFKIYSRIVLHHLLLLQKYFYSKFPLDKSRIFKIFKLQTTRLRSITILPHPSVLMLLQDFNVKNK